MKTYIGVDLGGTNIRAVIVDEYGKILEEQRTSTEADKGPDYVKDKMISLIEKLKGHKEALGIGIGAPGPINTREGIMIMATNLPGFTEYPIARHLTNHFKKPTFIDNDANVAGLAEALVGAGKAFPTIYYVTLSTGIGGALIVEGKLVSGGRGHAGEIGNIIVKNNGYKFGGLNPGAVEAESSGTALVRKGREIFGDKIEHAGDIFELATNGDQKAIELVDEFIENIATLLANIAHTVDPHAFVIGGGVMISKEHFFERLNKRFNELIHVGMRGHIKLLETEVVDCGAVGAAMLPMSLIK